MARVLKDTPSATDVAADTAPSRLADHEQAASPYEEHLLSRVMEAVYHSLSTPKYLRQFAAWMHGTPNPGAVIGHTAFLLLSSIYQTAKHSGVQIPVSVFFAQGGAVYQTIEQLMVMAEHMHIPDIDSDHVREVAMGTVVDSVKKMFGPNAGQAQQAQQPQQAPQMHPGPPMARANPMAHAVGQGLQQQGLMGAQQ